jgi:molecular chaperone GrpE (heat shock protein)
MMIIWVHSKLIKRAIKKYGAENFIKEILFVYDNENDMNQKKEVSTNWT